MNKLSYIDTFIKSRPNKSTLFLKKFCIHRLIINKYCAYSRFRFLKGFCNLFPGISQNNNYTDGAKLALLTGPPVNSTNYIAYHTEQPRDTPVKNSPDIRYIEAPQIIRTRVKTFAENWGYKYLILSYFTEEIRLFVHW